MMQQFTNNIWFATQRQRVFGLELGARMTIVDVGGGDLFVHSPIRLTAELVQQIQKLGTVRYVVAPNKWHHLYINDFRQSFPLAQLFCAPGLEHKRADVVFDGVPLYNEVVFFDPRGQTLIVTDLAVHICESSSWFTRVALRLMGAYGKFGWSALEKKLFIKDPSAFQQSLQSILQWDFEKIMLAHGTPVDGDGKTILRQAFFGV